MNYECGGQRAGPPFRGEMRRCVHSLPSPGDINRADSHLPPPRKQNQPDKGGLSGPIKSKQP